MIESEKVLVFTAVEFCDEVPGVTLLPISRFYSFLLISLSYIYGELVFVESLVTICNPRRALFYLKEPLLLSFD